MTENNGGQDSAKLEMETPSYYRALSTEMISLARSISENEIGPNAERIIGYWAEISVMEHGLPFDRVYSVFKRAFDAQPSYQSRKDRHYWDNLGSKSFILEYLYKSFGLMSPLVALELCEAVDMERLGLGARFLLQLNHREKPFYSLDELNNLTAEAIRHLDKNHSALLTTGWPRLWFQPSVFLRTRLDYLCPTKQPIHWTSNTDADGNMFWKFTWPSVTDAEFWVPDLITGLDSGNGLPVTGVDYDDAPHKKEFGDSYPTELTRIRPKLYYTKLEIMKILQDAIKNGSANNLWEDCLNLITARLTGEEACFLIQMDKYRTCMQAFRLHWGGLTHLLEMIGHYEEELTIGLYAGVKDIMEGCLEPNDYGIKLPARSYLEARAACQEGCIDKAVDYCASLESQYFDHWNTYTKRVNRALAEEFCEEMIIRKPVKRKLTSEFKPYIEGLFEYAIDYHKHTGSLPEINYGGVSVGGSASDDKVNRPRYLFRKGQDNWTVIFNGEEVDPPLSHQKGLDYIAFLLAHPIEEYYALQIIHEVDGTPYEPDEIHAAMSSEELGEYDLSVSGFTDTGEIMDPEYETDCRNRLVKAQEDLKRAKARNDTAAAGKASRNIEQYRRALNEGIGLSGRHRTTGSPREKARVSVTTAIKRVLTKLQQQHPVLYDHLSSCLRTGTKCSYNPSTPIDWIF